MEVAQKRLALQLEKLEVDKQLLRAEKKHLKQEMACQREEINRCHARIHQLEVTLEKTSSKDRVQELREKLQQAEQQVEELQTLLHKDHDTHDSVVGELEQKIAEQETLLQQYQSSDIVSPSKQSSNNYAIQQYKNKLQSLRLAMEVAVRRTETEWKEKVDDLEVQLATQEGEFEDALERKTEELQSQVNQLREQLDYCEKSRAEERMQLDATIEQMRNGEQGVDTPRELSLARDEELCKTKEELNFLERKQDQYAQNRQVILKELRALIDQINSTESQDFSEAVPLIREKAMILEEQLNALEIREGDATSMDTPRPLAREPSRKMSRINEKKLRHVSDLDWIGSNQKGKYTGYVNESGEPHGRGTLRLDIGDVYEGEFKQVSLVDFAIVVMAVCCIGVLLMLCSRVINRDVAMGREFIPGLKATCTRVLGARTDDTVTGCLCGAMDASMTANTTWGSEKVRKR